MQTAYLVNKSSTFLVWYVVCTRYIIRRQSDICCELLDWCVRFFVTFFFVWGVDVLGLSCVLFFAFFYFYRGILPFQRVIGACPATTECIAIFCGDDNVRTIIGHLFRTYWEYDITNACSTGVCEYSVARTRRKQSHNSG